MTDAHESALRDLAEQVARAASAQTPLALQGGGSKTFYGRAPDPELTPLDVTGPRGVVQYEPTEMVITAAAGTPLDEIERTLAERGQMLGFEPPHFGPGATLGGAIACGLSGPSRPYTGSARDFVLGVRLINGQGQVLRFGGQVIKNVAGYDLSRLVTGSLGTLGVLLEVSLKVQPRPAVNRTLVQPATAAEAIERFNRWAGRPYPVNGAACDGEQLYLRLAGAASGVEAAARALGGDPLPEAQAETFWHALREQTLPFFAGEQPLWRLSLAPASDQPELPGSWLIDWGGAQRWLRTEADPETVFAAARRAGGHAVLFRGGDRRDTVFQPLDPVTLKLHQRLKASLDPAGILNPGRLYPEV
ncbi:MAG: glycolate oxidase subunit GlcE [Candidatus Competibacterales bacterium]|nr:glycolate oxidase subunit GlcE [Candidatus Competibacterales bacterium]